jgi:sigma-B regulation protein RsbU (phosphoserine phosphatase)
MAPPVQQMNSLFKNAGSFILNIGADPRDSEYVRLIKRIYYGTAVFGCLASAASTVFYFLSGNSFQGWLFLFSFVLFLGTSIDGLLNPRHFRWITLLNLVYFVIAPAVSTIMLGGIWRSEGIIYIGLMGPLLGLVFFLKRRWAVALFLVYWAVVLGLAILQPRSGDPAASLARINSVRFWLGFLVIASFIFGVMYFFVVQRDKAYRLLDQEKAISEKLLRRIEKDLEQAAKIQKDLLPKENPRLEGYDISGLNVPCYEVGGDYYDFVPIDADRLGIVIADVSGKGISASLLMASLRAALLAEVNPKYEIARMVARLNDFVFKSSGLSSFITFFYGELDRRSGELRYVNAGHNPPFVLGQNGQISSLQSSGFPLGMFPQAAYEAGTVKLAPGDLAALFTDGIPEARNAASDDFGEERLQNLARTHRDLAADQLGRLIIAEVQGFATGTEPGDDVTLVIIKRGGEPAASIDG